jgi:hypothetical protein
MSRRYCSVNGRQCRTRRIQCKTRSKIVQDHGIIKCRVNKAVQDCDSAGSGGNSAGTGLDSALQEADCAGQDQEQTVQN